MAIARLFTFVAGDPILASEVNGELDAIITELNDKPDANGVIQTTLNADLLDDYHASLVGGDDTIPVCKAANIQIDLNTDLLDGLHASDISQAAFVSGTTLIFYQAAAPTGWSKVTGFGHDYHLSMNDSAVGGVKFGALSAWDLSGITGTVDAHVLTIVELPAHGHAIDMDSGPINPVNTETVDVGAGVTVIKGMGTGFRNTTVVGTNTGHSHTLTGVTGDGVWRPPTAWVIACTKD